MEESKTTIISLEDLTQMKSNPFIYNYITHMEGEVNSYRERVIELANSLEIINATDMRPYVAHTMTDKLFQAQRVKDETIRLHERHKKLADAVDRHGRQDLFKNEFCLRFETEAKTNKWGRDIESYAVLEPVEGDRETWRYYWYQYEWHNNEEKVFDRYKDAVEYFMAAYREIADRIELPSLKELESIKGSGLGGGSEEHFSQFGLYWRTIKDNTGVVSYNYR